MTYELAPEIREYYIGDRDEAARLVVDGDGRLELLRSQELLRPRLPAAPADVLDVGGGPGIHARWLTADGYRVHLVDPVEHHVEQAAAAGLSASVGDARALDAADGSVDVVLLLGPLYHLVDRADRDRALAEAHRVLRPGGVLAAAGISRYSSLLENTANGMITNPKVGAGVGGILQTGQLIRPRAFTTAYFHTAAALEDELATAGFGSVETFGVEGPCWSQVRAVELHTGKPLPDDHPLILGALAAARMADGHPDLLAATSHLLAIGRRG